MAKQFFTNGTGSQQTLTPSQNEKVAIYDTIAEAEADLANLEAGQIVATPDTGDELAQPVDTVTSGDMHSVTSNAVNSAIEDITKNTISKELDQAGWYKICSCAYYSNGFALKIFLTSQYNYIPCASHSIDVVYGWVNPKISETCYDNYSVFDKIMITYESNNMCNIFVHYNRNDFNTCGVKIIGSSWGSLQTFNFEPADISGFTNYAIFNLGTNGFYADGVSVNEFNPQVHYLAPNTSIEINLTGITMYRISAWFYGGIYYLGGGVNNLFGQNKNINTVYKMGDALGFAVTDNKVTIVNNIVDAFHISIEKIL